MLFDEFDRGVIILGNANDSHIGVGRQCAVNAVPHQQAILGNQQRIERNQAKLERILENQATILSNQGKLDQIVANQERILANQQQILAKLR